VGYSLLNLPFMPPRVGYSLLFLPVIPPRVGIPCYSLLSSLQGGRGTIVLYPSWVQNGRKLSILASQMGPEREESAHSSLPDGS